MAAPYQIKLSRPEETPNSIAQKLNSLSQAIDVSVIKGAISKDEVSNLTLSKVDRTEFEGFVSNTNRVLKNNTEKIYSYDNGQKKMSDLRYHGGGISAVSHDATLTGSGTPASPLSVVGGGLSTVFSLSRGWGAVAPAATTVYADIIDSGTGTETDFGNIMPFAGTVKTLYIDAYFNTLDTGTSVFTLVKNGTPTTISVTVNAGVTSITADTVHTVSVSAGDRITLQVVSGGSSNHVGFGFSYILN